MVSVVMITDFIHYLLMHNSSSEHSLSIHHTETQKSKVIIIWHPESLQFSPVHITKPYLFKIRLNTVFSTNVHIKKPKD